MAENIQQEEVLISAIDKSLGNQIHVRISRFKERDYLNIRNYYEDDAGEWKPTRKGISVPVEFYDDIMKALVDAKPIIDKRIQEASSAEEPAAE